MLRLDKKDLKIIDIIKQNSRLPIRDIAKKAQLKSSTVHLRLQKLIKNRIIEKFTLKLNNQAAEQDFIAFVYLTAQNLPNTFFSNTNLKEAFHITGEYNLLLKLKFKDISQFNNYLNSLHKNKSITKITTNVVTQNLKEELN